MSAGKQFWYDWPMLRSAILAGLAAAAVQLVVTYFQKIQQPLPDTPTYHVLSSGYVEPGQPASVRISARMLDAKHLVPVTIDDVSLDDHPVHFGR